MVNKIIVGSANFDQQYGVKKNFIKKNEIKKLFNLAAKNKIKVIDTSPLYKESEKIIGQINNNRFKVISKIPKKPKNIKKKEIVDWLKKSAINSLANLKIKKFECLLLQDANSLLSKNGKEIYKGMRSIKKSEITSKIGISIYDFKTLGQIIKRFKFDLVQAPLNIFDQRLIETGWLNKLKKRKIEVHVRSIFLQGILLLGRDQLPKKIKKFDRDWIKWENWLKLKNLKALQACSLFIFNQNKLDGVVIGFNNQNQLNQILKIQKMKNFVSEFDLNIKNNKLKDPRKWAN